MADPGTVKAGIELAAVLLKEAKRLGLLDQLVTFFKTKPRILVLGCTGTGKTNFIEAIVHESPKAIRKEDRTIYTEAQTLVVGKDPYRFIDTPGDKLRKDDRVEAIRQAMSASGGIAGVINVVSYGYHEYDIPAGKGVDGGAADANYLRQHRAEEIEQLAEWTALLGSRLTVKWLITLVTKADLWWDRKDEVIAHYQSGAYYQSLGDAKALKHRVLPFCSVFHKFYGEAPMSGTFDENDRERTRLKAISTLVSAMLEKQF